VLFIAATADAKIPRVRVAHQQRIAADEARFQLAMQPPSLTAVTMVSKYVVIVAGGSGHLRESPIPPSDIVIAFALP
jgi:glucose dehydrogenase